MYCKSRSHFKARWIAAVSFDAIPPGLFQCFLVSFFLLPSLLEEERLLLRVALLCQVAKDGKQRGSSSRECMQIGILTSEIFR